MGRHTRIWISSVMLASLLINNAYAGRTGKRDYDTVYGGRFVHYRGVTYDTQDKPEKAIVKRIARAIAEIDLPKEVRAEARAISRRLLDSGGRESVERKLEDVKAYRRLAEMLKAHVQETEDAALLMLLMEI